MSQPPKILIVGAGPTGLTAAVELARQGIVATVVEKREDASNLSRAVGILPTSLQLLEASGVAKALRDEGVFIQAGNFHRGAKPHAKLVLYDPKNPDAGILGLAQDRTEHHLETAFNGYGGTVRYGIAFAGLVQDDDEVVVTFEDGATEAFDYVIGADGAGSRVRQSVGLSFDGFDLPDTWSIADVDCDDWRFPNAAALFLMPKGVIQIVIALEAKRYRVISNTPDTLGVLPIPMNVKNIRREGEFTVSIRQVPRYDVGRVYLAGDSAHCHSPVGGRGMNLGISDAAELARRMVEGGLEGYSDLRHKEGAKTIAGSESARKMIMAKNPLRRAVVLTALWVISRLPFMRGAILKAVTST